MDKTKVLQYVEARNNYEKNLRQGFNLPPSTENQQLITIN